MSNNFTIKSNLIPAKARAKSLQGLSNVVANFSTSVSESVGTSQTIASTVVNNYYNNTINENSKIIRITVTSLLSLTEEEINADDLYLVFSSGSDDSGWSEDNTFEIDEKEYADGTFFQWINDKWMKVDGDAVKIDKSVKFAEPKPQFWTIEKPISSYWNLYGQERSGIQIATIGRYSLNDSGEYVADKENGASPSGAISNNKQTLFVPYARTYQDNGTQKYQGGALTAADYEKLCNLEDGGGGGVTITNTLPSTGSRLATINNVDIYGVTFRSETVLSPDNPVSFLGVDQQGYYSASANLLYNWFRVNNNLPYFYGGHSTDTVPSAYRYNAGMCVDTSGVWWYNGNKWSNIVPQKFGIVIEWGYTGSAYYFLKDEQNGVELYTTENDGTIVIYVKISGYNTADLVHAFLKKHVCNVAMNGLNNAVYCQRNLTALCNVSSVRKSGWECVKIELPNMLYYMPDEDNSTYIGVSFTPIL